MRAVRQVGARVPVALGAVARAPAGLRGVVGQAFDVREVSALRREAAVFGVYETGYSLAVVESPVVVMTDVSLVEYSMYL